VVQACLTATVVGPPGDDIHVNTRGEIRVRFHWDRAARGADSSCWIRTMHAWSGTGWGTQFIPRVGMEAVIGFDEGDPDRPIVLGCVNNATHPTAFPLPAQKTRSGFRTRSSPDREGHNELSFEDAAGAEQIYLRAQRDFDSEVERDRTARILHDDRTVVSRHRTVEVEGALTTRVQGDRTALVASDDHLRVVGSRSVTVERDANERVIGERAVRVEGRERTETLGERRSVVHGELTEEVRGAATMLVGRHDAKRSATLVVEGATQLRGSEPVDLVSEKEIVIRCGRSSIRIGPEEIEIASPRVVTRGEGARLLLHEGKAKLKAKELFQVVSDDKVALKSSGASLGLGAEAKLDGAKVLLNSPTRASDDIQVHEPAPTRIELVDQEGHPIPYQRFRVVLASGAHVTGFLDEHGKAEVDIEGAGEVVFPDLADLEEA
jgi:type VI secretion system secreted protein VgrG